MIQITSNQTVTNTDIMRSNIKMVKKISYSDNHIEISVPVNNKGIAYQPQTFNESAIYDNVTISLKFAHSQKIVYLHIKGNGWTTNNLLPTNAISIYRALATLADDITYKIHTKPAILHSQAMIRIAKIAWKFYVIQRKQVSAYEIAIAQLNNEVKEIDQPQTDDILSDYNKLQATIEANKKIDHMLDHLPFTIKI